MKVLTIYASIFIPLTFIVGVYGMNFDYIPELKFQYGYFILWGIMVALVAVMLIIFKKRNWF
jgi:magnesium transporter